MLVGYARVLTHDQNMDLHPDALTAAGCDFTDRRNALGVFAVVYRFVEGCLY
jgi:hypothetical protein